MKAPIFIKFDTLILKIARNYQKNFRKDPCTHARTREVNVPARDEMFPRATRDETCARKFTPCARACLHRSLQKFICLLFISFLTQVSNFMKIEAFVAEILAKQYWRFYVYKLSILYPFWGVILDHFWVVFWSIFFPNWVKILGLEFMSIFAFICPYQLHTFF